MRRPNAASRASAVLSSDDGDAGRLQPISPKPDVPASRRSSIARVASSAASSTPLWPSGPSGGGVFSGARVSFPGSASALACMFRLPLPLGGSHFLQLLLAHRARHLFGGSFELALGRIAALRRK